MGYLFMNSRLTLSYTRSATRNAHVPNTSHGLWNTPIFNYIYVENKGQWGIQILEEIFECIMSLKSFSGSSQPSFE